MDESSQLPRLMKRPELVVHEVVRHLEKTRNFRAFLTPTIVLKSVQAKLKKLTHRTTTQEELQDALCQAECDGLVYRVSGIRKVDNFYLMSRDHQQNHGSGSYTIIMFENTKYVSTTLRNLVQDILSKHGPLFDTEIFRIIHVDKQKFLNYELDFFRRNVLQDCLENPESKNFFC